MKGRRALPTAEALTGQKPRQRLTNHQANQKTLHHKSILPFLLYR